MSGFDGRTLLAISRDIGPARAFWLRISGSGDIAECWVWTGCTSPEGYGRVSYRGSEKYAHREAWSQLIGPIPAGLQLDHLCRNRACVNPWHLDAVTPRVNSRRGESAGAKALARDSCDFGHAFAAWGVIRSGRRACRLCRASYLKVYNQRRRSNLPAGGIDQREALAGYSLEERAALASKAAYAKESPRVDVGELAASVERDLVALIAHQEGAGAS